MEKQNNTHIKTINGVEYRDLGENLLSYYNASPQPEVYLVKGDVKAHPTQSGTFIDQGCRAVKFTTENIVGEASYGGPTSTEAGGAMVLDGDGVYTLALKSVTMDYRHATLEEIKSRRPEAQVSEISDGIFATIQKTLQK